MIDRCWTKIHLSSPLLFFSYLVIYSSIVLWGDKEIKWDASFSCLQTYRFDRTGVWHLQKTVFRYNRLGIQDSGKTFLNNKKQFKTIYNFFELNTGSKFIRRHSWEEEKFARFIYFFVFPSRCKSVIFRAPREVPTRFVIWSPPLYPW